MNNRVTATKTSVINNTKNNYIIDSQYVCIYIITFIFNKCFDVESQHDGFFILRCYVSLSEL